MLKVSFIGEDFGKRINMVDGLLVIELPFSIGLLDLLFLDLELLEIVLAVELVVDQLDLFIVEGHGVESRALRFFVIVILVLRVISLQ